MLAVSHFFHHSTVTRRAHWELRYNQGMKTTNRLPHSFYYWVGIICLLIATFLYNIATGSPTPLRQKELLYNNSMKEVKECWQLLEEALEVAPSQDVKDAIANVIDQL